MRARLLFVMIATGCAISAATACSSPEEAAETEAKTTTQASSVTIAMFDKVGGELGSCSGTLIAKDLVLTAGHCAAGASSFKIDSRGADMKSESTKSITPWQAFGSKLSHPDHSDVAILVLKTPIPLDKYPAIATTKLADGASALRFQRSSANATAPESASLKVTSAKTKGFKLDYIAKVEKGAFLDTGGAIIDPKTGNIHGVISGIGDASGMLHIARVDNFVKWLKTSTSCGGAQGLTTRTYPGGSSSSSSSSGSSGDWGGGASSSSGGDWGGYGGGGDKLEAGAGGYGGGGSTEAGTTGGGTSSGGTTSGGTGDTDGGTTAGGTPGAPGGDSSDSSGPNTCPPSPTCEGDCPGGMGGGGGTGGSNAGGSDDSSSTTGDGTPGSGGGGGGGTTGDGTPGSGGGGGGGSAGTDVCPGPPTCPEPDDEKCVGPACGGCATVAGCVDSTIDYGSCASCGTTGGSSGSLPVVR